MVHTCGTTEEYFHRMLKKAVQQGPASEEVKRTPRYVEPLSDARTPLGEKCVLAHRGRAGEKSDFFSILLGIDLRVVQCYVLYKRATPGLQ